MKNQFRKVSRAALIAAMTAGIAATGNLSAYETKYTDKKMDDKTENNTEFKVDGVIFAGYERTDTENNGVPDSAGVNARNQGFDVKRAYINLKGDVTDGEYKGYGFRITLDGGQVLGASGVSSTTNPHYPELKYAYMHMPLFSSEALGNGTLRLGMQHTPTVDAQAGSSIEGAWKHRYIDTSPTENIGFSSSADMGIGYIQKADYFGLHLLLGNGEGFRKLNGQNVSLPGTQTTTGGVTTANAGAIRSVLHNLSNQTGTDSYGVDLYGNFSIKPTGKAKDFELSLNLPFRLQNVGGIRGEEVRGTGLDVSNLSSPKLMQYIGDKRAKQDQTIGQELDVSTDMSGFKMTVGLGHAVLKDKRSTAIAFDQAGPAALGTSVDFTRYVNAEKDAYGSSNYGYIHARYGMFGLVYRDMYGTGSSGTLSALPSKSYAQQLLEADVADGILGNGNINPLSAHGITSTTNGLNSSNAPVIDLGKARFRKQLVALEFFPAPRWSLAIGMTRLTSTDTDGYKTKVSGLAQVNQLGSSSATVENQAATAVSTNLNTSTGYNSTTFNNLNDFSGEVKENKQYFIRAQYEF